jgi:hypothetical protein
MKLKVTHLFDTVPPSASTKYAAKNTEFRKQSSEFLNENFHAVQTADLFSVALKSCMWSSQCNNNFLRA